MRGRNVSKGSVTVIGAGYVGLTVAAALSAKGYRVTCVDRDEDKLAQLRRGRVPFAEADMDRWIRRGLRRERLRFTAALDEEALAADVVFVAVGTPAGEDGRADVSAVFGVARELVLHSPGPKVVVVKSTVPVGTGDRLEEYLRAGTGQPWHVVSNPEFLREGTALADYFRPDRIVIGAACPEAAAAVQRLYAGIRAPVLLVDRRTAELIKYAANAFLAAKISLMNEIADLCQRLGVDAADVSRGVGLDHRIGPHFLRAGLGYGGSCLPKDVAALIAQFADNGLSPRILPAVQQVNRERKDRFLALVEDSVGDLRGAALAVWGLSFKAGTDDLRNAPALDIVPALLQRGARLRLYDPAAGAAAPALFPGAYVAASELDAARDADAVLVLTDWPQFARVDLEQLRRVMARPLIIDGRGVWPPEALSRHGFVYRALGRGARAQNAPVAPPFSHPLRSSTARAD